MNPKEVHELLRSRMSVYPPQYTDQPIEPSIIKEILESANWAPTHKITEPWRFKVFTGKAQKKLGDFMAEQYRKNTPKEEFSLIKYEKRKSNPRKAGCVIAICMQRDPAQRVPEWEEVAAVAAAVQNLWLAASAHGLGGYWSTPPSKDHLHEHLALNEGERCLGFFYLGHYEPFKSNRRRSPVEQKIHWIQ